MNPLHNQVEAWLERRERLGSLRQRRFGCELISIMLGLMTVVWMLYANWSVVAWHAFFTVVFMTITDLYRQLEKIVSREDRDKLHESARSERRGPDVYRPSD